MWLTVREAAELLGISKRAVQKRVKEGKMKAKSIKSPHGKAKKAYLVWVDDEVANSQVRLSGLDKRTKVANQTEVANQSQSQPVSRDLEDREWKVANQVANRLTNQIEGQDVQVVNDKMSNGSRLEWWLSVKEVAQLLGVSERAIQKKIEDGELTVREIRGKGRGGRVYQIALSSLPGEVQVEYLRKLSGETPDPLRGGAPDPLKGEMPVLTDWQWAELGRRLEAVRLALSALKFAESKVERIKEIAREFNVSEKTLYRWMKNYRDFGIKGLIPKRRESRIRSFSREALEYALGLYLSREKPSVKEVYQLTLMKARDEGWKVGSYQTLARYIDEFDEGLKVLGREGIEEYKKRFMHKAIRDYSTLELLEVVVADHTPLNIFVLKDGKPIRPWLTAFMDLRSRMIVGYKIVERSGSGNSIAEAFRHAVMPKKPFIERNPKPDVRKGFDWESYEKLLEKWDYPAMGLPQSLYLDNGKDFRAKRFWDENPEVQGGFRALGIEVTFAIPYHPWSKAIERFFRTLKEKWISTLPGAFLRKEPTKRDKKRIEADIKAGRLLTWDEFELVFEMLIHAYHHTEHSGVGMDGMSPIEVWYSQLPSARIEIPSEHALIFLLMKREARKITSMGIQFMGHWYWCDELVPYVGKKVQIRWSDEDLSKLYVFYGRKFIGIAVNRMFMEMGDKEAVKAHIRKQKRELRWRREMLKKLRAAASEYPEPLERLVILSGLMREPETKIDKAPIRRIAPMEHEVKKAAQAEPPKTTKKEGLILWRWQKEEG